MPRFLISFFIMLGLVVSMLASPVLAASALGTGGGGAQSYNCGIVDDESEAPFPAGTQACVCDKQAFGDCGAMQSEACKVGFLSCQVGSTKCWCVEKPEGPNMPPKRVVRDHRDAPGGQVVAPTGK